MVPKKFTDLEIEFAEHAAELKPAPIEEAILDYTGFYGMLFVPSPKKDPNHELWLSFINYLKGKELKGAAYEFYANRTKERDRYYEEKVYSGKPCFIYHTEEDKAYLHFNNNEGAEPGPLSKASMPVRLKELKDITQDIHDNHSEVRTVNGYSWLYNIPAYTRLFPPEFISSGVEVRDDFGFNIYGQFLDSSEQVKADLAQRFLDSVNTANSFDELLDSFPFYPIRTSAPVEVFYDFYGITS